MLTFPGAPPDIGCTWVHYSFSTTFGSRRVRTSVCVSLVADDTTCTCVPFICVSSCRYAYLFSLFQYLPLSLSFPPFPFHSRSPSLSILFYLYLPSLFRFTLVRFIVSLVLSSFSFLSFFLSFLPSFFLLYLSSPSFPFLPLSLTRLRPSTLRQIFPCLSPSVQRVSLARVRGVNVYVRKQKPVKG